jgi:hypothetical protein
MGASFLVARALCSIFVLIEVNGDLGVTLPLRFFPQGQLAEPRPLSRWSTRSERGNG